MLQVATKFRPSQPGFELAYQAGFRNAELWLGEEVLLGWTNIRDLAQHYPFKYVLHFPNNPVSDAALDGCLKLYEALGCQAMVIHEPMFAKYAAVIQSRAPQIQLAIENHWKAPEQLSSFAEQAPGITLDIEHLWLFTWPGVSRDELVANVKTFWKQYGHKVKHMHFPGVRTDDTLQHCPMYYHRELVFQIFDFLESQNYRGLIVSESDPQYQTLPDLTMDVLLFDVWRLQHDAKAKSTATK
jgi:hypothetical protein